MYIKWTLFSLKKDILSHATTWKNFMDILVNKISQSQRDKYYMRYLVKFTENRMTVFSGVRGRGIW